MRSALPDAVVGALVAAGIAALGYVGKLAVQGWQAWRRARAERIARLQHLRSLLRAAQVAFDVQKQQRDRLAKLLDENHPDHGLGGRGYEWLFSGLYEAFTPEERDLHVVIRGYTEHALHPLNKDMLEWLRSDSHYRVASGKTGRDAELAAYLERLEAHLLLWMAKYHAWIANRPEHALVYLADEQKHGLGFPHGIEAAVDAVLVRFGKAAEGSGSTAA